MSYMGSVELKASDIRRVDVTGSTSATHTLTWTAPNEQSLIVTINGVKQQNNYTVSGTTLTLDTALITTDALEVIGINDVGTTITPAQGSVNTDQLATDAVSTVKIEDDAVTDAKLANSINTDIAANTAKVTNATHTGDVTGATALTIAADAVTTAKIVDDAVTAAKLADSAYLANRNIVINGAMQVAQRSASLASVTTGGYNTLDRWKLGYETAGTWTLSRDSESPDGFGNSFKFDCTTANASLSSNSFLAFSQQFEGQDLQQLKKGTASAESVTLSFWVRSTLTGTHIVELYDQDNNRQISGSYTISVADTWEKKSITYAGDTTGAFDDDNAKSLFVQFWLAAGTDYSSGTLNTSWASATGVNRAVGQVNTASSTSNNFYITGVQLEIGTTATPFEHKTYGQELFACQRYYRLLGTAMTLWARVTTGYIGGAQWGQHFRGNPSTSLTGEMTVYRPGLAPSTSSSGTIENAHSGGGSGYVWNFYGWTGLSVDDTAGFQDDYIECDAEL